MIPAILAAVGRTLAGRAAGAVAARGAGALGQSAAELQASQSVARKSAVGRAIRSGRTPQDAMKAGDAAEKRLGDAEAAKYRRNVDRITSGFEKAGQAAEKAARPMELLIEPFDKMSSLAAKMGKFVGSFSPADANQLTIAMNNWASAIGKVLLPTLKGFVKYIDSANRWISGMEPVVRKASIATGRLFEAIGKFAEDVGPQAAHAADAYATAIVNVTKVMQAALPVLTRLSKLLPYMVTAASGSISGMLKLLINGVPDVGYKTGEFTRAVNQPGISHTSAQQYDPTALASIQSSYSDTANTKPIDQQQLDTQKAILDELRKKSGGPNGVAAPIDYGQGMGGVGKWINAQVGALATR